MTRRSRYIDPNIARKDGLLKEHLDKHKYLKGAPLFSTVEFNIHGSCNRKCVFCPRSDQKLFSNVNKGISLDLYTEIVTDLGKMDFDGTLLYSAFSEPLLHKDIESLIRVSKERSPNARVEIVTNGDLLTHEKLSRLFEAGLTAISVSMYDGPHQSEHFKQLQKKAGLRDDQFIFRVRWLSRQEHFGITLSNRAGTLDLTDIGITPLKEPMKRACYYPFYQILVDYDGAVLLCAHDWARKLIVGDVNKNSILEIWNNDILKDVRINLIKQSRNFCPCDLCDVEGVLMGENHFNKWREYYEKKEAFAK